MKINTPTLINDLDMVLTRKEKILVALLIRSLRILLDRCSSVLVEERTDFDRDQIPW